MERKKGRPKKHNFIMQNNFALYLIQMNNTNNYKIGITNNINKRIMQLQTGNPHTLILVGTWWHKNRLTIAKYERVFHRYFTKIGCRTETKEEWLALNEIQVNEILAQKTIDQQNAYIEKILEKM